MPLLLLLALQAAQLQDRPQDKPDGDEIVVLSPAKPSPQTPATMVVEPVAMMIAALDADGDGVTMRAEMEAGVRRSFDAIDTGRTGRLRYLAFADWALRFLGDRNALPSPFDVDRDGDGAVTPDELQSQFSRLYARFNTDGSDGVSRAELLTFRTGPVDKDGPPRADRPPGKSPDNKPASPPSPRGRR